MALSDVAKTASSYKQPSVAVLGSHSALDISSGARAFGLRSIVVCQKGREKTYEKYYTKRQTPLGQTGCIDEIMLLDKFIDIADKKSVDALVKKQALFVPHRSFSVYVGYDAIENKFNVPIFGNRYLLKAEERNTPKNQHWLLEKAKVRIPMTFDSPEKIDRLVIVKASEAKRKYERAFFIVHSYHEYERKSKEMLARGLITKEGLETALIEEFVLGAQFNFNFFASPLTGQLELMGTDFRRQTNLDGLLRLTAPEQTEILKLARMKNIEVGHVACTIRESLLERVFEMGEKFAETCRREYKPGLIGPFALQGAIIPTENGEEPVIFDVSFRVPGSPGVRYTPYGDYLWGRSMSVGERIALEVKSAAKENRLGEIVT
ncbi:5-formaminoimidazole-4-carboxamide-1-(beta)-D-ribofuranosyl 5'-monophosphate synthetase [uncultured archaeon]|nr:5-formaminoimidazole-4-carboxamide-1-(beta)-D-ribofuranosyl 5'-monophosphate synthetase [uncultured archaeon]